MVDYYHIQTIMEMYDKNIRKNTKNKKKFDVIDYLQIRNSYRGHLSYGNCFNLYNDNTMTDEELKKYI